MKITVYSTSTCPYCIQLKDWLDEQSIKYDAYDIETNPIAAQNMMRQTDQEVVPFTTIEYDDGKVEKLIGFNVHEFEAALKK